MNTERNNNFRRWWKKNHHTKPAHYWLIKHSKRTMHNYNIAPEQFDYTNKIMKRYNLSLYKRLSCEDALFLWRLTHPSMNQRRERLLATAVFFEEKRVAVNRKLSRK
jgi:hypothetical protein